METPEPKLPDTNTESNFPLPFESLVVIIMSVLVSYFPLVIVLGATMDPETAEPDMTLVKCCYRWRNGVAGVTGVLFAAAKAVAAAQPAAKSGAGKYCVAVRSRQFVHDCADR